MKSIPVRKTGYNRENYLNTEANQDVGNGKSKQSKLP